MQIFSIKFWDSILFKFIIAPHSTALDNLSCFQSLDFVEPGNAYHILKQINKNNFHNQFQIAEHG